MFNKIERYTTEQKKQDKFIIRVSSKLATNSKNTKGKITDFKRMTMKNLSQQLILDQGGPEGKNYVSVDWRRKNFVVSRKKKSKISYTCPQKISLFSEIRNNWIQEIVSQSYQGLRDYNEDRILIKENLMINETSIDLFAVFDGHGGSSVADYLKLNLAKVFTQHSKNYGTKQALEKSLQELQSKILMFGAKLASGSCATILVLKENQYFTANIGDSRILIVKDREEYCQLTQDHKPQNPKEKSRIQKLGGKIYRNMAIHQESGQKSYGPFRVHPSKLSVSRTLGDYLVKKNQPEKLISSQPEFTSGRVEPGDVILLMSDGAYQKFTNNQISILFSTADRQPLKNRLSNYIFACKKRSTNDNVSIIAIQIKDMKEKKTSMEMSTDTNTSNKKLDLIQIQL